MVVFLAFYTACLGLCDVHVSKGRETLESVSQGPSFFTGF